MWGGYTPLPPPPHPAQTMEASSSIFKPLKVSFRRGTLITTICSIVNLGGLLPSTNHDIVHVANILTFVLASQHDVGGLPLA